LKEYTIAVIPGDGIGKEVIPAGCRVLDAAQKVSGNFSLRFEEFSWGTDYYVKNGMMMPKDALKILEGFDAIYLGAIGYPALVPDHITLWGLLLPIRKAFEQYINVRPTKLLPGVKGPLRDKGPEDIDFVVIRENTEGEYSGAGGRVHVGTPHEVALQTTVFTRTAVERVMRYSFELARKRPKKKLTNATKSNAQQYSFVFWDEVFAELSKEYPDVQTEKWHVDALTARFVTHPETLDVVVGSNLFADILTDLGGAIQGSMGLPPSANINPERTYPSMFESVHGSAPDIAGKGIANPIAAIWAGSMMMSFLGEETAAQLILDSICKTTAEGKVLTPDLGGGAGTVQVAEEICRKINEHHRWHF
jgi:tartrate dehydrogenase/decarboxylase/D-malate dehydrogenase